MMKKDGYERIQPILRGFQKCLPMLLTLVLISSVILLSPKLSLAGEQTTSTTPQAITLTLNNSNVSLTTGQAIQLLTTITPDTVSDKSVTWSIVSQNPSNVITLSSSGLVTAQQTGIALIKATSNADPNIFAEWFVTVTPTPIPSYSAAPVVKIGVNHNADNIAGMFIGLDNIIDSATSIPQTVTISGYQIEITFDPNQVFIPDVLAVTTSGALFAKNIENDIGKVRVVCVASESIGNYDKLFFIPITLKGSAQVPTSISIKYLDVRDNKLHRIQLPTQNLKFQRGKIYNGEPGNPNIGDAIAGLQYLAMLRNPGPGPEEVNLVNMAAIIETSDTNVVKPNIKDIIALIQYSVNLRDDHFVPVNPSQKEINFGYKITNSTGSALRLELDIEDLENGDLVQVVRGSDNTNVINPITVQISNNNPLVIDSITIGEELYLKIRITRGNNLGERLLFKNLKVSMGTISATNITDIRVKGLKTGDIVSLYKDDGMQIGGTQSVDANSTEVIFSGVSIVQNGVKVQISRPTPASNTPSMFFNWGDLIIFGWKTDITANGLEALTVQFLESGDVVNLFDSDNVAIQDKQGLVADAEGKVIISDLAIVPYHFEVVRGGIHSRREWVEPPEQHVDFGAGISKDENGNKQLRLYNLQEGDRVEIFKGSNDSAFMAPFTVPEANPNPWVIDDLNFGNELYLKVRVTRNGFVGEQDVFEDLYICMGAIAEDNTTNINLYGLKSGDQVRLYLGNGPQFGSVQNVGDSSQPTVFSKVPILEDDCYRFEISRTDPVSSTGMTYRRPKDLIEVWCRANISDGFETLTMQFLHSGDVINLYDSEGNPIAGKQGIQVGTNGEVTISGLEIKTYQFEVIRGTVHSNWEWVNPPEQHVDFGAGISKDENGNKQLRLYNLQEGDRVEIFKGSNDAVFMAPFTVPESSPNPLVFDNINLNGELYLKVRVTRNGIVDEQNVFDDLFISLGAITNNTTSITLYGIKTGDQVNLYRGSGAQIGSTLNGDTSIPTVFTNVPLLEEEGYKFEISRTILLISTGMAYGRPRDLITVWWETYIADNGLETLTMLYLESGDMVNLYDSEGNPIAEKQGLLAGTDGKVTISDLEPNTYQVEVVRATIHSHRERVEPPTLNVDFGAEISTDNMNDKQLSLYDLKAGDQVKILIGSDNSNYISPFTVTEASPNPWVLDNVSLGNELFLKVIVTRYGYEGIRYVYDNVFIHMGAIAEDNTTSVNIFGLQSGDQVSLYRGDRSQIGSTQSVVDSTQPLVFTNISLTGENGVQFKISRPNATGSSTGEDYRRWKDMIAVKWDTHIENSLESLTLQDLEDGDVVILYDTNGDAVTGQPSQSPNSEGEVTFSGLELRTYQVKVRRGDIETDLRRVDPPTVN